MSEYVSENSPEPPHQLPSGIGRPATSAFLLAGYTNLEELSKAREADLAKLHGVGPKALRIIKTALAEHGWSFADDAGG